MSMQRNCISYLRFSSSAIVTVALLRSPSITLLTNELETMAILKVSGPSNKSSSVILILKLAWVTPGVNVTEYCPES